MARIKLFAFGLIVVAAFASAAQARLPAAKIDSAARAAMQRTGARGLALAVIEDGKPTFVRAWGHRNAAGDPLRTDTIMYGASLTKAVFAYTVMQLVEEGRLGLDRPVAEYLPRPLPEYGNLDAYGNWGDLAGDERWRKLTARHLLTHSPGFRNFSWDEPDGKLRINFDPGARYAYSGEGIILLQFVIEKGLGLDLGAEMQKRVFDRFGMKNTSMMWRPDFARNLADGWKSDGKVEPHDERSRVRAAGSMDTTIADFARFAAAFMRGQGLKPSSRAEMLRARLPITSVAQFPTLAPEAPPEKRWKGLAAGLGIAAFEGPQGRGFFKGGHNDSAASSSSPTTSAPKPPSRLWSSPSWKRPASRGAGNIAGFRNRSPASCRTCFSIQDRAPHGPPPRIERVSSRAAGPEFSSLVLQAGAEARESTRKRSSHSLTTATPRS